MKYQVLCFLLLLLCTSMQQSMCLHKKRGREKTLEKEHTQKPEEKQLHTTRYGRAVKKMLIEKQATAPSLHAHEALNREVLKAMLKAGADVHEVQHDQTPLHRFTLASNTDCIEAVLLHGAQLTSCDSHGNSPLHMAAHRPSHVALALLISPQGSPTHSTEEMQAWKESIILFAYALKKRTFPRDIRSIIVHHMLPEPHQLINWVPLYNILHYMQWYSPAQREKCVDLLIKRHIADLFYALDMKNKAYQTPQSVAISRLGRMGMFIPPVQQLNRNNIGTLKPMLQTQYAKLVGLPEPH